jgi:hypothetical protein
MTQSRTLAVLLGAAMMAMVLLAPAAQGATTKPGYEQFKGCPTPAESATSTGCIRSLVTGGTLKFGTKEVPIEKTIELSGGVNEELQEFIAGPEGGLSKTPQKIPGGVLGLTGLTFLLEFFGSEALTLYGTTELAAPPSNFTVSSVTIPIKVHLTTPSGVLGNTCYIGSNSNPITLNLITGTTNPPAPNKPITGKEPTPSFDAKEILHLDNGIYVDNSFAVPGASGCVLKLFGFIPISLNGFVNSQAGLPSAAGHNEARQNFSIEIVERVNVY